MIKKISIASFGKFRNYQVPCAPVTILEGANESGKTTIFDALLDGLCKPKGTTEAGKLLKTRYGETRSVTLEFEGTPLSISAVDFLNLFAIRAGDLSVEVSKDSEWLSRVKAQLFSGGIDPISIANELTRQCESRAKNTLNGELRELREKVASLEKELQELQHQREAALREEQDSVHSEEELERVKIELANIQREEGRLRWSLDQQKLHRYQKELLQMKASLESAKRMKQELEEIPSYTVKEQEGLRTLERKLQELDGRIQKLRTLEEEAQKELQRLRPEIEQLSTQSRRLQQIRDLGVSLKARLQDRSSFIEMKTRYTFKPVLLILAAIVLSLGLSGVFIFPKDLSVLPLVIGMLGAALLSFLGIRRETREDDSKFRNALEGIYVEWEKEGGDPIPETSWEGFVATLERTEERLKNLRTRLEELYGKEREIRNRIETLGNELGKCRHEREEVGHALKIQCDRLKVRDSTHYTLQMEKRSEKESHLRELNRQLEEACKRYGQSGREELEGFLLTELERIQGKITEAELPETDVRRLENVLREWTAQEESLEREEKRLIQIVNRKKGEVSGAYRDLPERIVRKEKDLFQAKALLKEKERSLKGAERAAELFRSLSEDNDALLSSLSEEIGNVFSRIAPVKGEKRTVEGSRKVSLKTFSLKETEVMDAGGSLRPFGAIERRADNEGVFLSSGTRDAFLLAARLTLARKAIPGHGTAILVMDEPFLTLDIERVDRAIEVLQEFHQATGWQIFFFTKEKELAEKMESRFGHLAKRVKLD
ncbi:MAG: hypothetical protein N2442_09805 [Spirochaetes bacterium]|nr:hypothetical protein [Spirochaetota bacterium]